jgi:hypothetical protein
MPIYNQGSAGGNYIQPGAGFIGGPPPAAPTKPKKPVAPYAGGNIGIYAGNAGATNPTIGAGAAGGALIGTISGTAGASPGGGGVVGMYDPPTNPTPGGGGATPAPPAPPAAAPPAQYDTDPQVMINKLLEQLGIGTIDADLKAQRERAIIGWGDPDLAAMAGFGIDPQAGVFAQQNYLSGNAGLAKINKQHDLNSRGIVNKLAGRGLLRSGDLGYQTGEENQAYASNQYEGRQKILEYLTQISQQAQDRRNALRQSVIQSVMAAYQNMGQNPQAYASLYGG